MNSIRTIKRGAALGSAGIALALAGVLGASGIANASETLDPIPADASAYEEVALGSGGLQALATKYPKEGGKWNYGTTGPNGGGTVYSNYYHPKKSHGSTVVNANKVTNRSPVAAKGKWSNASTTAIPNQVDRAYYWLP